MYIALFVSDFAKINVHTVIHIHYTYNTCTCTCNIYCIGYTVSYMCISKLTNEKLESPLSLIITIIIIDREFRFSLPSREVS